MPTDVRWLHFQMPTTQHDTYWSLPRLFAVDNDAIANPTQSTSVQLETLRRRYSVVPGELERFNGDKDAHEMGIANTEFELLDAPQQLFIQLDP